MGDNMMQPMIGEPAPQFTLPALDGEPNSLAALQGEVVVIHFGTSW